jgi:uncharacterized protein
MEGSSVSKIKLILEISGKQKLECELKRHLSPRTVGIIMRTLPMDGNAHMMTSSIAYLESTIESGVERQRKEFKKGDIAFLPNNGSICFFIEDTIITKTMSPLGRILSNVDALKDVKSGDTFSLYSAMG